MEKPSTSPVASGKDRETESPRDCADLADQFEILRARYGVLDDRFLEAWGALGNACTALNNAVASVFTLAAAVDSVKEQNEIIGAMLAKPERLQ